MGRALPLIVFLAIMILVFLVVVVAFAAHNIKEATAGRRERKRVDYPGVVLQESIRRHARTNYDMLTEGMSVLDRLLTLDTAWACLPQSERERALALLGEHNRAMQKRRGLNLDDAVQQNANSDFRRLERLVDLFEDLDRTEKDSGMNFMPSSDFRKEVRAFTGSYHQAQRQLDEG